MDALPPFEDLSDTETAEITSSLVEAIQLDPHNAHGWYNLGLIYKFARAWEESALCNLRAAILIGDDGDAEFWNLGIAATALSNWGEARWAWSKYGIELSNNELRGNAGEIIEDFGPTPIRIFHGPNAEVVWGRRICPARVAILSVPLPTSGHRWGDVVLNDGAPNGTRIAWEQEFPVFEELERLHPSEIETLECIVQASADDINTLLESITNAGWGAEDWTSSVQMICKQCSEGDDPPSHKHGSFDATLDGNTIGIGAPIDSATTLIDQWINAGPDRSSTEVVSAEIGWHEPSTI